MKLKIRIERLLMACGVMATHTTAALMVRAQPAVGLGEGERMRVVWVLNFSKGRRYGVVGAAVRHGE
jgi:hypothetical protein